jgi:hypothetical protein
VFVPVKGAQNQFIVIAERPKQMDALHQSVLVAQGSRHGGRNRQVAE